MTKLCICDIYPNCNGVFRCNKICGRQCPHFHFSTTKQRNSNENYPILSYPILSYPIRKLCLTLAAAGALVFAPSAAADCVKPQVSGYDLVGCLTEDLAWVRQNGSKYGFIDKTGKLVIPLQYDDAGSFSEEPGTG
uniref:WG repeat-containing protein n=1 Tax=Conchiformibius kuhniae TaxID=211502 RepID=A0A8T9MXE4_9NEIS|nr:WG repeat-containing protein [Conchiformibius kuhniae]